MLSGLGQFIIWKDESLKGSGRSGCPRCSYVAVQVALCRGPSRKLNSAPQSLGHLARCIVLFSFLRLLFWFPFNFVNVFLRTEKNILPSKFVCLKYCVRSWSIKQKPEFLPFCDLSVYNSESHRRFAFGILLPAFMRDWCKCRVLFLGPWVIVLPPHFCHCGPSRTLLLSEAVGCCSGIRCFNWVQSHVGPVGVP